MFGTVWAGWAVSQQLVAYPVWWKDTHIPEPIPTIHTHKAFAMGTCMRLRSFGASWRLLGQSCGATPEPKEASAE